MKTKTAFLNIFFLSVVIVTFLSNSVWAKVTGPCGAWIRYPSDAALPETYAYTVYEPLAPVARPDLSGYSGPSPTVTPGTDLVMCLSCHRAHGSPYASMLRWSGSEEDDGCKICHTTND